MAQETNTFDRYDLSTGGENVREALADVIYNISPEDTPLMSNIGREKAESTYREWLIDKYATVSHTNAHIDGNQFSADALVNPVRVGNYLQISKKQLSITRRANKVNKAGRSKEMAYQLAKSGAELKRDMEAILHKNQAASAGTATAAPKSAGLFAWIGVGLAADVNTSSSRGAGLGADGALSSTTYGYVGTAAVEGTARALSEATLLSIIKAAFLNGGKPTALHMHPTVKVLFSNFMFSGSARIATPYQDHGAKAGKGAKVLGSVDYYVSDFGTLEVVPNQFQDADTTNKAVYVLDYDYLAVAFLDSFITEDLAKLGDASDKHILSDYTLVVRNAAALGIVADINSGTAMTT